MRIVSAKMPFRFFDSPLFLHPVFHAMRTCARLLALRLFVSDEGALPASTVPPMLRRRLSPLGRLAAAAALAVPADNATEDPIECAARASDTAWVFASRRADIARAVEELRNIRAGDGVSPAHFATSVHNGIEALLSIAAGHTGAETAVAGGLFTAEAGFEAAVGLLSEYPRVLLLVADEAPESVFGEKAAPAFAGVMLLGRAEPEAARTLCDAGAPEGEPLLALFARPKTEEESVDARLEDPAGALSALREVFAWLREEDAPLLTRVDRRVAHVWTKTKAFVDSVEVATADAPESACDR